MNKAETQQVRYVANNMLVEKHAMTLRTDTGGIMSVAGPRYNAGTTAPMHV